MDHISGGITKHTMNNLMPYPPLSGGHTFHLIQELGLGLLPCLFLNVNYPPLVLHEVRIADQFFFFFMQTL